MLGAVQLPTLPPQLPLRPLLAEAAEPEAVANVAAFEVWL